MTVREMFVAIVLGFAFAVAGLFVLLRLWIGKNAANFAAGIVHGLPAMERALVMSQLRASWCPFCGEAVSRTHFDGHGCRTYGGPIPPPM